MFDKPRNRLYNANYKSAIFKKAENVKEILRL